MQIADVGGVRRPPQATGERAVCPCCKAEVIAKCGTMVVQHWAHRSSDCDPWSEPESEWHQFWKAAAAPPERREVVIGPHRADAMLESGIVVEIQRSPLSVKEIAEREAFYADNCGGMVWVLSEERSRSRTFKSASCPTLVAGPAGRDAWFVDPESWPMRPMGASALAAECMAAWLRHVDREMKAAERQLREVARKQAEQAALERAAEDRRRRRERWEPKAAPLMAKHGVDFETAVMMAMANEIAMKRGPGDWQWRCLSKAFSISFAEFFDSVVERMKQRRPLTEKQGAYFSRMHDEIVHGNR